MNKQLQTSGNISNGKLLAVQNLYNNYAAMLLGYIFEAVKNQALAEQYLVAVFSDVPHELDEFSKTGVNALCYLQLMARKKLSGFFEKPAGKTGNGHTIVGRNKYINLMSPAQQQVFCGIHYYCKTIAQLAAELNMCEEDIRKILKECFTIIRNGGQYAEVH